MWDDGCSLTVILFHVYLFIYLFNLWSCCFTMTGVLAHFLPFSSFCSICDFSIDGSKKTLTLSNCVFLYFRFHSCTAMTLRNFLHPLKGEDTEWKGFLSIKLSSFEYLFKKINMYPQRYKLDNKNMYAHFC